MQGAGNLPALCDEALLRRENPVKENKKMHYAWLVLLGLCAPQFFTFALQYNTASLYLPYVTADLGFSVPSMALYFTTHGLIMAAATVIVPRILSKINVKTMLITGEVVLCLCVIAESFFTSIWHWYLMSVITGICCACVQILTPLLIINNWFVKKNGLATGIFWLANGLGGAVFSPIVNSLLNSVGWRQTYLIAGCLALLGPVIVLLFVRFQPADKGLMPYGHEETAVSVSDTENLLVYGPAEREALKSGIVVLTVISAGTITILGSFQSMMSTYASYVDMLAIAGTLLSCFNIGYSIANFLLPTLADKLRTMKTASIGLISGILAAILFLMTKTTNSSTMLLTGGVLFGVTTATMGLFPIMVREVYGTREFAKLFSYHTITQTLVGSVCITVYSLVMEKLGVSAAMYLVIVAAMIAWVTLFVAIKSSKKKFQLQ